MSQKNVEIVRFFFETFRAALETDGLDAVMALLDLDAEVEWDPHEVAERFGVPDIDRVYVGVEGGEGDVDRMAVRMADGHRRL